MHVPHWSALGILKNLNATNACEFNVCSHLANEEWCRAGVDGPGADGPESGPWLPLVGAGT